MVYLKGIQSKDALAKVNGGSLAAARCLDSACGGGGQAK